MSTEESKILLFPIDRISNTENVGMKNVKMPTTVDEIKINMGMRNHVYIDQILDNILPIISNQMNSIGFDVAKNNNLKDGGLFVEAFRSMLCKQYDISHPFQKLADEIFEVQNDGHLRIVSKIKVTF